MSEAEYRTTRRREIEQECRRHFGSSLRVQEVLFDDLCLGRNANATVFSTPDHSVYAFCEAKNGLRLGDVQRLVKSAGFIPGAYSAPHNDKNYFRRSGRAIFLRAYPGRTKWTDEEEAYYQLLVPYSPALVQLRGLRGPVRRFNIYSDSWQTIYEPPATLITRPRH